MKNKVLLSAVLFFVFMGSLTSEAYAIGDGDNGTVIILTGEKEPPKPKPGPKSVTLPAITAWYYSSNGELRIQIACPQGTLLVCIENQNGAIVCQQTINGNLPQVSLFPNLAPGAYKITICGANMELCGIIEVRKMVWSCSQLKT